MSTIAQRPTSGSPTPGDVATTKQEPKRNNRFADMSFKGLAVGAGVLILVVLGFVTVFLLAEAWPAFVAGDQVGVNEPQTIWQYVAPFAFGTVWVAAIALLLATPVAIGIALFISHYAPKKIAAPLGYLVDLLAAVPSVVFGLWGIQVLAPFLQPIYVWLTTYLGWIPLFAGPASGTGRTVLTVALVLAVMILPIMTAVCREVFLQTPKLQEEAASRTRRHTLGNDPHGGASRRHQRHYFRDDAGAGTRPRRNNGSGDGSFPGSPNLIRVGHHAEPQHDRSQHRTELPRGLRSSDQYPDCNRFGAVRNHPGSQYGRPLGYLPPRRILRSKRMSEDIASPKASSSKAKKQKPSALEVAGPEILAEIISLPEIGA